ncbi:MAG TPA: Ig-like domain-containing protein [Actinomycetes bacterium]|nr:Ig-like domain-containing protein [Actinomycetes bacterium]
MQRSGQHAASKSPKKVVAVVTVVLALALTGAGLLLSTPFIHAAAAVQSVGSGAWSDGSTWSGGHVPQAGDPVTITAATSVTVDGAAQAAGVKVAAGGRLAFDPKGSATLTSTRNIVVEGTLSMHPASASVVQTVRFAGVNDASFVGGGMDPLDSDVGLWVMGAGVLDLAGTPKTGWTRAAGSVAAGATDVPLQTPPTGWQAGDELSIAPTASPDGGADFYKGFDETTVAATAASSVRLATATTRAHPQVNGQWSAEVMDLTRNVRVEGTPGGNAHVFIRSSKPQSIKYAQIRHVGVLQGTNTQDGRSGRYGLHFHMMGDASRGSVVEGVVVRDAGSHTFVAHASNGITFEDDISYNNVEDAFWWDPSPNNRDPGDPTDDTVINASIVAKSRGVPDDDRDYRISAFYLGMGHGNTIRNSTAVGTGGTAGSAGFGWPEDAGQNLPGNGVWTFNQGNVSHNNHDDGLFVWQNTDTLHDVSNFVTYHNGEYGIEHGAYINSYRYANAITYGNGEAGINTKAKPKPTRPQSFENVIVDGGGVSPSGLVSYDHVADDDPLPTLFLHCVFRGQKGAAVALSVGEHQAPEIMDFVDSTFTGTPFSMKGLLAGTRIRVQDGSSAYQLDAAGNKRAIAAFSTLRGSGQPGPTSPPGLPAAPSTAPSPPTTQPPPSSSTTTTTTTRPPPSTATTATTTTLPPTTTTAPAPPPPASQLRITSPADGSTVTGIALVSVTTTVTGGVRRVDLYVDGVREQADFHAPFVFAWPAFALPAGSHGLQATLVRTDGTTVRSATVTVRTTGS